MDIKQLVNIEITKTFIRSSKRYVTAKEVMEKIIRVKNEENAVSLATVYRIFDKLIEIGECKKVMGGYVSVHNNCKKLSALNKNQADNVLKSYIADINKIISDKRKNIIERCFYAIIAVMLESDSSLSVGEISKTISRKYNLPDDFRRTKNIINSLPATIFPIQQGDNEKLKMGNPNIYISFSTDYFK